MSMVSNSASIRNINSYNIAGDCHNILFSVYYESKSKMTQQVLMFVYENKIILMSNNYHWKSVITN